MPAPEPGSGLVQYSHDGFYPPSPDTFHNGVYEVTAYYRYDVFDPLTGEVTTHYGHKRVYFEIDNLMIRNVRVENAGGGPLSSGGGGAAASNSDDYILWDPDVMPKGIYLFHLEAAAEYQAPSPDYATDKYRSGCWQLDWLQIVDTRFDTPPGYEQTPPPQKDYVRVWYKLVDSRRASQAFVELFDPNLSKIAAPIQGGKEVNANASGTVWNYADVPFTSITRGGEYVLLVSAQDDDGAEDKAHRQRLAMQRGVTNWQIPVINIGNTKGFGGKNAYTRAEKAWEAQKTIKGIWTDARGNQHTSQYQQNPQSRCVRASSTGLKFLAQLTTRVTNKGEFSADTNAIVFLFGHGPGNRNPDLGILRGKIIFTSKNSGVALDSKDTQLTAAIQRQYPGYSIAYLSGMLNGTADYCRLVVLVGCNTTSGEDGTSSKELIDDIVDRLGANAGISVGTREENGSVASTFCFYFWQEVTGWNEEKNQSTGKPLATIGSAADSAKEKTNANFRVGQGYSPEAEQDFKIRKKGRVVNQQGLNSLNRTLSPPWWGVKNF